MRRVVHRRLITSLATIVAAIASGQAEQAHSAHPVDNGAKAANYESPLQLCAMRPTGCILKADSGQNGTESADMKIRTPIVESISNVTVLTDIHYTAGYKVGHTVEFVRATENRTLMIVGLGEVTRSSRTEGGHLQIEVKALGCRMSVLPFDEVYDITPDGHGPPAAEALNKRLRQLTESDHHTELLGS